jgi:hypothetical protein
MCQMHAMSKPSSAIALKQTATGSGLGLCVKCEARSRSIPNRSKPVGRLSLI